MKIRLASFDIGPNNFAQYTEDFNPETIFALEKRYKKLPKNKQRTTSGPMNTEIQEILEECYLSGTRIQTGVYDFTVETGQGLDDRSRKVFLDHFNSFHYLWKTCDIFVIEQQYFNSCKKKKNGYSKMKEKPSGANIDCLKMAEVLYMWFFEKYPDKLLCYIPATYKTQILGTLGRVKKDARKKWGSEKAEEIYIIREDEDMINIYELSRAVKGKSKTMSEERIQGFKDDYPCETEDADQLSDKIIIERQKLDDFSEVLTQAQAFKYWKFIACF
jgi:hypothetical protein